MPEYSMPLLNGAPGHPQGSAPSYTSHCIKIETRSTYAACLLKLQKGVVHTAETHQGDKPDFTIQGTMFSNREKRMVPKQALL